MDIEQLLSKIEKNHVIIIQKVVSIKRAYLQKENIFRSFSAKKLSLSLLSVVLARNPSSERQKKRGEKIPFRKKTRRKNI